MSLFGFRGRADDWATFAKLEEAMTKIFGDKRAQWQKHADFSNLKQLKEQSVIDFAGVLKQEQVRSHTSHDAGGLSRQAEGCSREAGGHNKNILGSRGIRD